MTPQLRTALVLQSTRLLEKMQEDFLINFVPEFRPKISVSSTTIELAMFTVVLAVVLRAHSF